MRSRADAVRDHLDRVTHLPLAMWTVVHDKHGKRVVGSVMTFADLTAWADAADAGLLGHPDADGLAVTYSACWSSDGVPITLQCRSVAAEPQEAP